MKPNQLSNTAAFIAVKFYGLTRDERYRSLFNDDAIHFYEQLVKELPTPLRFYHTGLRSTALRRFFMFWEELLLPGDLMHIILRKYYLSQWVDELRNQGYEQMLVPGAGFDHLATINAPKGMHCVELDTPKMITLKKNFIHRHKYDHSGLELIEAFFPRDSLLDILETKTELDPEKKTIIIAEGFFDYFDPHESSRILNDLNTFFSGEVALLSTLFSLQELSGFRSFVYENSIKLAGEQLKLHLDKEEYISFLAQHNFKTNRHLSYSQMKEEVLTPKGISLPVLKGFHLLQAHRST